MNIFQHDNLYIIQYAEPELFVVMHFLIVLSYCWNSADGVQKIHAIPYFLLCCLLHLLVEY